jgi:hypothetical protein
VLGDCGVEKDPPDGGVVETGGTEDGPVGVGLIADGPCWAGEETPEKALLCGLALDDTLDGFIMTVVLVSSVWGVLFKNRAARSPRPSAPPMNTAG